MTNPILFGSAVVAGLAILLVALGVSSSRASSVTERLERYASGRKVEEKSGNPSLAELLQNSGAILSLNRGIEERDFGANLARDIARADLRLKVSEYLAIWAGITLGIPLLMIALSPFVAVFSSPLAWVIGAIIGFMLPRFWLGRRRAGRLKAFNNQLADTITLIANALRAGSSFLQAIEMVARETRPPISTEFGRVIREVNLGLAFDQALESMLRRVRSDDLELMVTAISIQHQVGGNLAEILDSIAFTIRERVRIQGEIRTLTAQQRMSGYVVGFLPIGLTAILFVIAPNFMQPMFRKPPEVLGLPAGVIVLCIAAFAMFMGFMIIRRIVDIEV
ncbi:MAG TPA: type II secretion system F family protein [Candidatus Saccharimonadales bacterium]|nr:type II secretion system F family protein [Candidatus Saccharimonadales bacterium]